MYIVHLLLSSFHTSLDTFPSSSTANAFLEVHFCPHVFNLILSGGRGTGPMVPPYGQIQMSSRSEEKMVTVRYSDTGNVCVSE